MIAGETPMSGLRSLIALMVVVGSTASATAAAQTIYKVTDKDGKISYTDVAPEAEGSMVEEVSVAEPNTAVPVSPRAAPLDGTAPTENMAPDYLTLISRPADGTTVPIGPGDFTVEAQASPALGVAERLQLKVDGTPFEVPQTSSQWRLTNIARGAHELQVMRLDDSGNTIDTSDISTVYVLRPSVLN
jgi:hypothetical protein